MSTATTAMLTAAIILGVYGRFARPHPGGLVWSLVSLP
jgi:hypothetical protein